ncbi:MAG: hypothetical protein COX77_01580 [Candidatus Komeilibacteria bacterium CG_4_10_14_0_2_um_filter_37_10]|uniref:Uncharacterized protein n=1 Tax=Candidatus Komeilibacteria bacterium CG_4_10_14_0_2_um_filter_37_10 TaxID=1974470 RepID=A0A2M7VFP5_9BACT|nr:MAG: hypothetical protein COX77_01580 [Candidatus Komeilibacteria bacterium CG_4_10_14_0_2_um_filter_37_10]
MDNITSEYLFKDKSGQLFIWQSGQLQNLTQWLKDNSVQLLFGHEQSTAILDTGMEEPLLAPLPPMVAPQGMIKEAKKFSLEKIIDKLILKFDLVLIEEQQLKLSKLLFVFFRGARQAHDVRLSLTELFAWPTTKIDAIMQLLKEIKEQIANSNGEVVSVNLQEKKWRQEDQVKQELKKAQLAAKEDWHKRLLSEQEKKITINDIPAPTIQSSLAQRRVGQVPEGKKIVEEIRKFNRMTGPLEEISQMNVKILRRLASSTAESLRKIEEKIDVFSAPSLARRMEIVKAWQSSPIYQQYLRLGRLSLEEGVPINLIVERERQKLPNDNLNFDEFNAISLLNKKLRF